MRLYEEQIRIPLPARSDQLLSHIAVHIDENLPVDAMPLRFAATRTCKDHIDCEVGVLTGLVHRRARTRLWTFVGERTRAASASPPCRWCRLA